VRKAACSTKKMFDDRADGGTSSGDGDFWDAQMAVWDTQMAAASRSLGDAKHAIIDALERGEPIVASVSRSLWDAQHAIIAARDQGSLWDAQRAHAIIAARDHARRDDAQTPDKRARGDDAQTDAPDKRLRVEAPRAGAAWGPAGASPRAPADELGRMTEDTATGTGGGRAALSLACTVS